MSFTPGPWEVTPDGLAIKTEFGRPGMDESQLLPVRLLSSGVCLEANGRLIAAAPELLAACQMEEIMANYRAQSSWSDQSIQFFRRLGEMATAHGWDGNDTPLSEFVRDFRRQAIASAIKESTNG